MLRTPTYYAFKLYVSFQESTFVPIESDDVPEYRLGDTSVPNVSVTAVRAVNGDLPGGVKLFWSRAVLLY